MSGFAAVLPMHGSPRDLRLLDAVRRTLHLRDPEKNAVWKDDAISLLHAGVAARGRASIPLCELDGRVVVFDGRLDAREDLARELRSKGREAVASSDDAELIAHAFAVWETSAPEHLIGDFSFVLWDRRTRELTCVRDRFGVRPMYHALSGATLLVSNDLTTLLAVDGLADRLNESAIADFLLFSGNQDLSTTTFASIHRVPPAHSMIVSRSGGIRFERYWSLPVTKAPRRVSASDDVEEFQSLFQTAVKDRAQGQAVVISLSGGLDSTSVAAAAVRAEAWGIHAVTAGYERMFVDEERRYAAQSATSLGISWEFLAADQYTLFERWSDPRCRGLEPTDTPIRAAFIDLMARLAVHGRVLLTGQGGDSVLYTSHGYFVGLLRRGRLLRAAMEAASYAITRRRRPPLLLRSHAMRALRLRSDQPPFPTWIREDFARAQDLRARWASFWAWRRQSLHPRRPEAALFTLQPMWPNAFESYDFAWTGSHLELSVPFLDTRLVEFLFTLPPMPHFADKDILRQAMKGQLPEKVRTRAKAPLAADPVHLLFRQEDPRRWASQEGLIDAYADPRILQSVVERKIRTGRPLQQEIAALCLVEWLNFR